MGARGEGYRCRSAGRPKEASAEDIGGQLPSRCSRFNSPTRERLQKSICVGGPTTQAEVFFDSFLDTRRRPADRAISPGPAVPPTLLRAKDHVEAERRLDDVADLPDLDLLE